MAVFRQQRPTRIDKCGNLTIVSTLKIPGVGHHFVGEVVGGAVRHRDLVAKSRNFFFFACLLVIRENLCSRKFPAIRYYHMH